MKSNKLLVITALLFGCFCLSNQVKADNIKIERYPYGYPQTDRQKECINKGWKFHLGDPDTTFYTKSLDDSKWKDITVPHSLALTSYSLDNCKDDNSQKTFHREVGWYRKNIKIGDIKGKVVLEFEGCHQITTLWVNGKKVGIHKTGGYTPFRFDITSFVKKNSINQITVLADNRRSVSTPPDGGIYDYIKFSGLYRDVYLLQTNNVHITSNLESMNSGVTITTPTVDYVNGSTVINIRTEVRNESTKPAQVSLVQRIVDQEGQVVLKLEEAATIKAGNVHQFNQIGGINDNLRLWCIEDPYLYKVNTTLYNEKGKAIDVVDNPLGIRKFELDNETGFKLNGKNIKLIGMNRHQHFPYVGDAVPNSLNYRDMIQFKQWGFNCVRTAHYPQDNELLKACDELGILVYEEAPTWMEITENKEWYSNLMDATRTMIRNHKNHPSLIIWGTGINHRGPIATSNFVARQEDPTRLTASQSCQWSNWQASGWADIFANMDYESGFYDRQEPYLAMEGRGGLKEVARYKRDPQKIGLISWTAHAYYSFHSTEKLLEGRTRGGYMDIFRYPKIEDIFGYPAEMLTLPYLHFCNTWTPETETMTIYSNADHIELLLNGKSLGIFRPSTNQVYMGLDHAPYEISHLPYEEGKLTAKGYRQGQLIVEESIYTPGKAAFIHLKADTLGVPFKADGNDLVVIHAEIMDANRMILKDFEGMVHFKTTGDASILGDPEVNTNPFKVIRGASHALVLAGNHPGKVTVTATCEGLKSDTIELHTVDPGTTDCMLADAYPIYDHEAVHVDLGNNTQFLQFGWTLWHGENAKQEKFATIPPKLGNYVDGDMTPVDETPDQVDFNHPEAWRFSVSTISEKGMLKWHWGNHVVGKESYYYGDGVLCVDEKGLCFKMTNLPAGNYKLVGYHHSPASHTNVMDKDYEKFKKMSGQDIPSAKLISATVNGRKAGFFKVTSGRDMNYIDPGTSVIDFKVNGPEDVVKVIYKSEDSNISVWLNAFKLLRAL